MTDLGKMGSLGATQSEPEGGEVIHYHPPARAGFSESRTLLGPSGGSSLLSCCLSLSDEQEDESMENTGKVEPV